MKFELQKAIAQAVEKASGLKIKPEDVHLEHPENEEFGDYATNIAMAIFSDSKKQKAMPVGRQAKSNPPASGQNSRPEDDQPLAEKLSKFKNPLGLAEAIKNELLANHLVTQSLNYCRVAAPGFINISIKNDWFIKELGRVLKKGDNYGKSQVLKNKKIMVEFTDPNPFKEFHIGHLYSNIVGESLARLFEANGALVKRANYQGDVGMHVAKSIWGLKKKMEKEGLALKELEKKTLNKKVHFLGQAYALGATAYEKDKQAQEEIRDINYFVYVVAQEYLKEKKGWQPQVNYRQYIEGKKFNIDEIRQLYNKGRAWSLEYFETIYKRLGTKFDYYYFESVVGEYGVKIVKEYLKKGIFQKSKGAIIFPGEKYGFHTRVFINSLGLPTYEAKDIGLAHVKYQDFSYDKSFNVTGNEIDEYFKVVLAALKEINLQLWKKTTHLSHGMVRLPGGKMSSRTGKIVTGEELLAMTIQRAADLATERVIDWVDEDKARLDSKKIERVGGKEAQDKINEEVGIGAVKYALLKNSIGQDVVFDFDKSISLQGNSGPYLQYTYARCRSVIAKAGKERVDPSSSGGVDINAEELTVLRTFYKFPEVVLEAGEQYAPNLICSFLYDLAQKFNTFYNKHRILTKSSKLKAQSCFRLALTAATAQILKTSLYLLGIKAPRKM